MQTMESIIIARPVDEVFAFVTDLRNELRWQPEILAVTAPPRMEVGATFTEIRRTFGCRFEWLFRITAFDAPNHIAIETIRGRVPYRGARIFEDLGGVTRVTEVGSLELPWALRWADPILERRAAAPVRGAYERLRGLLEGSAPARVDAPGRGAGAAARAA